MKLFASMSCYALGWALGAEVAMRLVTDAIKHPESDTPALGVLTLRTLRQHADLELRIDTGASHLAKSRSRHFAAALESDCDAWLSVDDDVHVDSLAVRTLLAGVAPPARLAGFAPPAQPRIVLVPCPLRGKPDVVNVEFTRVHYVAPIANGVDGKPLGDTGGFLRRAVRGGFGCVAMNRAALRVIADAVPWFWDDVDAKPKPAPFLEMLDGPEAGGEQRAVEPGRWHGEDFSFFKRVPAEVEIWAVVCGNVAHGEVSLNLAQLRHLGM
jgi:hypothetical protein